jgi:hypothetical protein
VSQDFSTQVDTKHLDAFIDKLFKAPELVEKHMKAAMQGTLDAGANRLKAETPVGATGHLSTGWATEITGGVADLTGEIVNPILYGLPVEHGRKPGKFPPLGAIAYWLYRKGIVTDRAEIRSAAFLVARAIAEGRSTGTANTGVHMTEETYQWLKSSDEPWKSWDYELDRLLKELAK